MCLWRRGDGPIRLWRGSDRLWMMRLAQWTSGAESNLSVIGLRRTVPMRTSVSQLALIGWATSVLIMSHGRRLGCQQRLVLAQIATDTKSNEITADRSPSCPSPGIGRNLYLTTPALGWPELPALWAS